MTDETNTVTKTATSPVVETTVAISATSKLTSVLLHFGVEAGTLGLMAILTWAGTINFAEFGVYAPIVVSAISIGTSLAHKYLDQYLPAKT